MLAKISYTGALAALIDFEGDLSISILIRYQFDESCLANQDLLCNSIHCTKKDVLKFLLPNIFIFFHL